MPTTVTAFSRILFENRKSCLAFSGDLSRLLDPQLIFGNTIEKPYQMKTCHSKKMSTMPTLFVMSLTTIG